MTPEITGFVTRADAELVDPRSISRSITPEHGGAAVHWGGSGFPPATHDGCLALWKRWQGFHMSPGWAGLPNGGSDIAYTGGYCNHGYAFAGRGIGVRSGAQGTKIGNDHYYAFAWLGGAGGRPNDRAKAALLWWIAQARASGAGDEVRPHSWFKSTSCPGDDLRAFAAEHHDQPLDLTGDHIMFMAARDTDAHRDHGWPDTGPVVEYYQHLMRRLDPSYDPEVGGWGDGNTAEFAAELRKYSPGDTVIGPGEHASLQVLVAQQFGTGAEPDPSDYAGKDHDHDGRYLKGVEGKK